MRVWVTRTAPEAEATAERLRALGHAPLAAPLLELKPRAAPPDLRHAAALAFTSRNGVRAFAALSPQRALRVYAVGSATAEAAAEAGFGDVRSAEGDVDALAALIAAGRGELGGEVVHAGPDEPAGDLVGALKALGVAARLEPVYAAHPAGPAEAVLAALKAEPIELDAVLVHSPRAGRRLAEVRELIDAADRLQAFCISEAAAEPLRSLNFRSVAVAPFPNETSLLNLLGGASAAGAAAGDLPKRR